MKKADEGYTLIALLVMIAVGAVLLATIAPTWSYLSQRNKEEELIFRGESYAFAIERYRTELNKLPTRLDALIKDNYIRKLYLDPITDGPFELIVYDGANRMRESELRPTQRRILRGETPGTTSLGIIGVASTSTLQALRPYKEKEYDNEWEFFAEGTGQGEDEQQDGNPAQSTGQTPDSDTVSR